LLLLDLPCLTSLDICGNETLTSQGFDAYLQSTSSPLQSLDISYCFHLQQQALQHISNLSTSLQSFKAVGTDMTGDVLNYLASCSHLHTLHLSSYSIRSTMSSYSYILLDTLGQTFSSLRDLWIDEPLSDECWNGLSHITTLTTLCVNVRDLQSPIGWYSFLRTHQTIQSRLHSLYLKGQTDFSTLVTCYSIWFSELSKTQVARFQMDYYGPLSVTYLHIVRNRQRHETWCRIVFLLAWMRTNHDNGLQDSGLDFVRSAYWGTAVNSLYQFLCS
jgi:hypothetical protein